ncbi:MAG: glycine cleavage system aminomethyltransferase GcvT [Candidatus Bathyarchaeia archaeon]|nr:glycine cleavage system aminomethyltransferase GcvT [Candidatus Bathyarchaeota archaeon]
MRTHLYEYHKKHAHLTNFAGFEMPLWYEGITSEHLAVREKAGIFDVTHMGRYIISGKDSETFLNNISTRDVASIKIGQGKYSVICNEDGGIIDDVMIFRLEEDVFLIVCNAANRVKDYEWFKAHAPGLSLEIKDVSNNVAMFAIQGPKAAEILQKIVDLNLKNLRYGWGDWTKIGENRVFISRTGYTGEDGFEIFIWDTPLENYEKAYRLWNIILEAGSERGLKPCGLGARDTLRIEAGFCLYGNDINEAITPFEAKLDFAVNLGKDRFIGREALIRQINEGIKRVRVGISLLERGVPRAGCKILSKEGNIIGEITSGTFSPLLKCGIGMGYVSVEYAKPKTEINVQIREKCFRAEITDMPFYDTTKYGRNRKIISHE